MHRNSLLALATVFSSLACIGAGEPAGPEGNGAPPLSAEDQEIVSKLEANKLAEVEVAGGKVTFFETEPGEFIAKSDFPIGAAMPAIPNEASLADAFHAVAPGQAIPARMQQAMDRAVASEGSEVAPVSAVVAATNVGAQLERTSLQATPNADGTETKTSALASVIDWNWFYNNYCTGYAGPFALTWCMAAGGQGAWARGTIHYSNMITCGDTGAGRLRMKRSGSTLHLTDFAYGQCTGYWYHGPHDILGGALTRTVEYINEYVQQSVRFAGYMKSADSFNSVPAGF